MISPSGFKPAPSSALGPHPERSNPQPSGFAVLFTRIESLLRSRATAGAASARPAKILSGSPVSPVMLQELLERWEAVLGRAPAEESVRSACLMCKGEAAVQIADSLIRQQALCLAALLLGRAGVPVHLVYAREVTLWRELDELARSLGLTVAVIGNQDEVSERRGAYLADIVAVNYRQLMFDYLCDQRLLAGNRGKLRERLLPQRIQQSALLRGLSCALIVDGSDVLIEASQQPIALTAPDSADGPSQTVYEEALTCAGQLLPGEDYGEVPPQLTANGELRVASLTAEYGPLWRGQKRANSMVRAALHAIQLEEGVDYFLTDQQVGLAAGFKPVDELQVSDYKQLLASHLGLGVATAQAVSQRLSLQHFFVRYLHLAATGPDLRANRRELRQVYSLHYCQGDETKTAHTRLFRHTSQRYAALWNRVVEGLEKGESLQLFCRDAQSRDQVLNAMPAEQAAQLLQAQAAEILLETDQLELQQLIEAESFMTLIAVDTPASLAVEQALCARLKPGQALEIFGSADEPLFSACGGLRRRLLPLSKKAYNAVRYHALAPQRQLREQVAAQDAYIRQTLSFTGEGN